MYRIPVIWIAAFVCASFAAACNGTGESPGPSAAAEVELLISDPDTPPEEILALIDFVSYRITCPNSGLTPFDDSIDLNGNLEVNENANPPVWQLITQLPLSTCTISLWVFYEDEVVCLGSEVIPILEDSDPAAPSKVAVELECNLSTNTPSGPLDIDADFEFIDGNFCPKLNWLGAVPVDVPPTLPADTNVTVSAFDPDETCGLNCDPQTCDFTQNPPVCGPGPDPGFSVEFFAPAGRGSFIPSGASGTPINTATTYTCDPSYPGPTEVCVRATDGDADCDKVRCVVVNCPDLCANVDCGDDGDDCTSERCDPLTGQCVFGTAPDGIACAECSGTCVSGACTGPAWTGDVVGPSMNFIGTVQTVNETIVNPYSGGTLTLDGTFNVNTSSYQGTAGTDTLVGTNFGDLLFVQEPLGNQTICGVEVIVTQNSFDAMILADEFVILNDMFLQGGRANDVLWANVGNDNVNGNEGDDIIDGGPGDDTLLGGSGNDTMTLWPGSGFDTIDGQSGIDTVQFNAGASQIQVIESVSPVYTLDLLYLGQPVAQTRNVETLELNDALINLAACINPSADICGLCGNGTLNGGEECDDGNNDNGDGCAADCTSEF